MVKTQTARLGNYISKKDNKQQRKKNKKKKRTILLQQNLQTKNQVQEKEKTAVSIFPMKVRTFCI